MASVLELANLANMTYDGNKQRFRSWVRETNFGDRNGRGFYAELYFDIKANQAVLAIRGTEPKDGKDWA